MNAAFVIQLLLIIWYKLICISIRLMSLLLRITVVYIVTDFGFSCPSVRYSYLD